MMFLFIVLIVNIFFSALSCFGTYPSSQSQVRTEQADNVPSRSISLDSANKLITTQKPGCASFKVMSYNIHHGLGMNKKVNLDDIAKVIRKYSPDFVALQEVDDGAVRSFGKNQAKIVAESSGMKFFYFSPSINIGRGKFGNAFLSNIEAQHLDVLTLPYSKEKRTAQVLKFNVNGVRLMFVNTHFDTNPDNHFDSLTKIERLMQQEQEFESILLGDLNTSQNSSFINHLRQRFFINLPSSKFYTFRSDRPRVQIDYIAPRINKGTWTAEFLVPQIKTVSDHFPILSEIRVCDDKSRSRALTW